MLKNVLETYKLEICGDLTVDYFISNVSIGSTLFQYNSSKYFSLHFTNIEKEVQSVYCILLMLNKCIHLIQVFFHFFKCSVLSEKAAASSETITSKLLCFCY